MRLKGEIEMQGDLGFNSGSLFLMAPTKGREPKAAVVIIPREVNTLLSAVGVSGLSVHLREARKMGNFFFLRW